MSLLPATPFLVAILTALAASAAAARLVERAAIRLPQMSGRTDPSGPVLLVAVAAGALAGGGRPPLAAILGAAAFVLAVAALTDVWQPSRGLRLAATVLAGAFLCTQGLCVRFLKVPFATQFFDLGWVGPVATVLWLALSGALFARAATIPSVSIGIGALAAGTLYAVCRLQPQVTGELAALLALTVAAACLGMLPFAPRLTHGQATAGGHLLGFLVGLVAVAGALKHTAFLVALLPLMIIGVPVFAATCSWLGDLIRGRRGGLLDRPHPHLHELLLRQGYSVTQVTLVLLSGTAVLCALALLLVALIEVTFVVKTLLLLSVTLTGGILLFVILRLMKPAHPPAQPAGAVNVLGVRVDRVTMDQAMARVEQFIREDRPHMIVTSDAIGVMKAQHDGELRAIINEADLVTADGAGVILAARLLGLPLDARVSGCDMVSEICRVAARMGRSVYLLGAAPGVAEKAAEKLKQQVPNLIVAGCHDGYFTAEEEPLIVADIAARRPAALFVALGIPRQERWIKAHLQELGVPVCIGVGGSFDVISGLKRRAPLWMQRCGLEWLYRVAKEPSRLPRLAALPSLVFLTFAHLLRPPDPLSGDYRSQQ